MNTHRIVHICRTVLLLVVIVSVTGVGHSYSGRLDDDPAATEIVVKLNPDSDTQIAAINSTYGTTTIEELLSSAGIYRLRVPAGQQSQDLAKQMKKDPRLLYAEPNYETDTPEGDGRFSGDWGGQDATPQTSQYAASMLGLDDAHALRRGAGVVVAVLDTGLQMNHPALSSTLTDARYDFIDDDNNPEDVGNGLDDDGDGHFDEAIGHGTHVAGIVHLVAPDAKIMPLRVLDADGRGSLFVIAEALLYAVNHGADVINLSLGTEQESDLMEDILEDIVQQHDVVIVAAAGNLNSEEEQFPASEDEVIAVTSVGSADKKSDFANYGDWIDVTAPGESIYSTFPGSGYAWWSGTSMSTPFVAGQVALIRSAVSTMPAPYVMTHVRESSQPIDSLNPGFAGALGEGRIRVDASLQAICISSESCQQPDLTGRVVLEVFAIIDSRPSGSTGNWIVGGETYVANSETNFREEKGTLAAGRCASVEYRNTQPFTALEIRSRHASDCVTVQPTATSIPASTPTPTNTSQTPSTATPTPLVTTNPTVTPTVMATPIPGITPTQQPVVTPTLPVNSQLPHKSYLPLVGH